MSEIVSHSCPAAQEAVIERGSWRDGLPDLWGPLRTIDQSALAGFIWGHASCTTQASGGTRRDGPIRNVG